MAALIIALLVFAALGWALFAFSVWCARDCEQRRYRDTAQLLNRCQDMDSIIAEYRQSPPKELERFDSDDHRPKQRGLRIRRG